MSPDCISVAITLFFWHHLLFVHTQHMYHIHISNDIKTINTITRNVTTNYPYNEALCMLINNNSNEYFKVSLPSSQNFCFLYYINQSKLFFQKILHNVRGFELSSPAASTAALNPRSSNEIELGGFLLLLFSWSTTITLHNRAINQDYNITLKKKFHKTFIIIK